MDLTAQCERDGVVHALWILGMFILVFSLPRAAGGDTITISGKTYENVYIVEEKVMYYVKIPETGEVIATLKNEVAPEAVRISPDPAERKKLLKEFKKKRAPQKKNVPSTKSEVKAAAPKTKKAPLPHASAVKPPVQSGRGVIVDGKLVVSNVKKEAMVEAHSRRVFEGRNGVIVLTNLPEKYEDSDDYIERSLGFSAIEVPERFRRGKGGAPGLPRPPKFSQEDFENIKEMVTYYGKYYGVEESLVYAVIRQESDFDINAVSSAGARGLMQLMPGTALEMGVTDIFDPAQNIAGGCQYLSKMLGFCNGSLELALAAYNAGPGNVKRYGFKVPPFAETQNYVRKVQQYKRDFESHGIEGIRLAAAEPVDPGFIPGDHTGQFEVVLTNGWTEIADEVMEKDAFYFLKYRERLRSIPKDKVKEVKKV